jgi:hypothetical protein
MKAQYVLTAVLAISPVHGFLLMNKLLAYERIDPIVQPGVVSGHLHAVCGNNNFQQTFDSNVWNSANCSTMEIQENKSNYWMPSLLVLHNNGTFSALPLTELRVYYINSVS